MIDEEIKKLAELSKLKFSEKEYEDFSKDFENIQSFFEQIDKVDVSDANEFRQVKQFEQLREDIVFPSQARELTLKNAPKKDSISFVVPKVVE